MKTNSIFYTFCFSKLKTFIFLVTLFIGISSVAQTTNYKEYKGKILDVNTKEALVFATVTINNTNISTVTNNEGEFSLKVPTENQNSTLVIDFLGYKKKTIALSELQNKKNKIKLEPSVVKLSEVTLNTFKDAKDLVIKTLQNKEVNNPNNQKLMTAFYRETIKKRKRNVSLAEAIVSVYKQSYTSSKRDRVKLFKTRKKTDYTRLDTLALKLQGGPYNALYIDFMKYPDYILDKELINLYNFKLLPSTSINGKSVYVVSFKQKEAVKQPLYYGKLYISSDNLALTSAIYNLNLENRELATNLFVRKKPKDVKVYPTKAAYRVDYREKNGKWYYGYSNVQLTFKVNRKGKLFNSTYSLSSEMAITDWVALPNEKLKNSERLKTSVIIADEASGFSDPEFWGAYNVIEPEKSIESAIKKIKKQLKKTTKS